MKAEEVRTIKNKKYMKTEKILADPADQQRQERAVVCDNQSLQVGGLISVKHHCSKGFEPVKLDCNDHDAD